MQERLDQLKDRLKQRVNEHRGTACLYLSGGSDSLLLLHAFLDLENVPMLINLDHTFTKAQRAVINDLIYEHDLRVFSYLPSNAYLIGDRTHVALIEEYGVSNGLPIPFIRDCVQDDSRCAFDVKLGGFIPSSPVRLTLHMFGTRRGDRHWATGRNCRVAEWSRDGFTYWSPLYDWTRKEVSVALKHYGQSLPKIDTGCLPMCMKCLTGTGMVECPKGGTVPAIEWDPLAMTAAFRNKFGFEVTK